MPKQKVIRAGYLFLIVISLSVYFFSATELYENRFLDMQFRFLRARFPADVVSDVVVVGIDEQSFRNYREPLALWHPHIQRFLEAMAAAGPSALALDLVLPERSYEFMVEGYDRKLLRGLLSFRSVAPIVLGQTIDENGQIRSLFPPLVSLVGVGSLGLVLVTPDFDGSIRRFSSSIQFGNAHMTTFAPLLAEKLGTIGPDGFINYSYGRSFRYVPFHRVNEWMDAGDLGVLRETFAGKPVILGSVLPFIDRQVVPVSLAGWEPGNTRIPSALVHAQILRSMLNGSVLHHAGKLEIYLTLVIATLFYWVGHWPKAGTGLIVIFGLILVACSTVLIRGGVIMPVVTAISVAIMAICGRLGLEAIFAFLEKRRLKLSFERYVSPNIFDQILSGNIRPGMAPQRRTVCVLFSDIRGFSRRCESESPEAIVVLLNRYFNEMTVVIHSCGGSIDKFMGDGLMGLFGVSKSGSSPVENAFTAAREMIGRLQALNEELQRSGVERIEIGIGIHVGEVVVGHVGSDFRNEYTVIGDTVNLAARLEGKAKETGYPVICSSAVAKRLASSSLLQSLGKTEIKGRSDIEIFAWEPAQRIRRISR